VINIFKKKSKITLDCFCALDYAYDYTPIDHGYKFFPEWWRDTPADTNNGKTLTIKNCIGVIEFYKKAVVIPSWFEMDLKIYTEHDLEKRYYSYESSNQQTVDDQSHHQSQFDKFSLSNGHNMKLTSPWHFRTKESLQWTWTQPTWNMRNNLENLILLPAVVNYKYQHSTNINFFIITQSQEKNAYISPNTPLVVLHPMTEKEIEIKNHLVDEKEFKRLQNIDGLFLKRTAKENAKLYSNKKSFIDRMGCPIKHE
jgi:hypothetical protein